MRGPMPLFYKLVLAAVAALGLMTLYGAVSIARFKIVARPAPATIVRHVSRQVCDSRRETVTVHGRGQVEREVHDCYTGQAPVAEYRIDGARYEAEGSARGVPPAVGAAVTVLYDPSAPASGRLEAEFDPWFGVVGPAVFGTALLLLALAAMVLFGGWDRHLRRLWPSRR
jgi:uncharacterized protein DUF3592